MKGYLTFMTFAFIFLQTPVYASLLFSPLVEETYIKELKSKNVTVVGYLSLGTIGGWEPWAEDVPTKDIGKHGIRKKLIFLSTVERYSS